MGFADSRNESVARTATRFATTHWSVVLAAGDSTSPDSKEALENLCRTYWYPLYAYVRHRGFKPQDAEDLVQGFFAYLLETHLVGKAQPDAGRFRSFLLGCMGNYLASEARREHAVKRGSGRSPISWDTDDAERRFALDAALEETPVSLFERKWAVTVLGEAMKRLEQVYRRQGKAELFGGLHPFLEDTDKPPTYRQVAERLGLTEGTVAVDIHRLRRRYQAILRGVVAETVGDLDEVNDELQHLFRVLSRAA
jgi:RNA polymerase sigma factor (sigma-70 family)